MSIFFSCPNGSILNFNRKKITDIFWNFEFPTRFSSDFHFSHPSFCLWVAKFEDSWKPPLKGVCRGNYITTKPWFSQNNLRAKHHAVLQFFRFVNCYHSFSHKIFSLLKLSSWKLRLFYTTKYDCFAPLESPKFAWHHHQTLDTYTISKFRNDIIK